MAKLRPFQPAKDIADAYNAVNPEQSLQPGDSRYIDFSESRGENIVQMVTQRIIRANQAQPIQYLKQLVAGHRGCGKSTDLLLLKERLETAGYFVVYFDSALELDMNDVDYADILLTTMYQLERQVRASPLKLKLDAGRLDALAMRLAKTTIETEDREQADNILKTEFRVEPQIPFIAKIMAAIQSSIKSSSTYKKKLRLEVQQHTAQFLVDLNDLINQLQRQLSDLGKKGLVIIIDSLDRIILRPLGEAGRRNTHSAIYLDHAEHLKAPHCHIIYTVPISVYFNENLNKAYPDIPLMIPMIKIQDQNRDESEGGLAAMHQAIAQRVDIAHIFEDEKSVKALCLASGGHIRDLLHLMRYACDYSDTKITKTATEKAIRALTREYDRLVKDDDLPRLVKVHREKRLPGDDEYAHLPYHLIVLEYQNDERWADLHPAVEKIRKFREVWKNESKPPANS